MSGSAQDDVVGARRQARPCCSCLCVTEDRPGFLPWLLWNYDKQDHASRELVVVDSSAADLPWPVRPDVRVIRMPTGTSVPVKRNRALAEAQGELVTWFDDDDWQSPRKLSRLAEALPGSAVVAGNTEGWFLSLYGKRVRSHRWSRGLLFNSAGFRRAAVADLRFDPQRPKASDTPWMRAVLKRDRGHVLGPPLFFWLSHTTNLSNPATRMTFSDGVARLRTAVGRRNWADTETRLEALRERLRAEPSSAAASRRTSC